MRTGLRVALFALFAAGVNSAEAEQPEKAAAGEALATALPVHPSTPVRPTVPPPAEIPPAPPLQPPPRPRNEAEHRAQTPGLADPGAAADGQWVCTSQYGWVFMPYGAQYAHDSIDADHYPYSYVYYPGFGWVWVAAPWVSGEGPHPYFGGSGPMRFLWYHPDLDGTGRDDSGGAPPARIPPAPAPGKRGTPRPGGFGGPGGHPGRDAPRRPAGLPPLEGAAHHDDGPTARGVRSIGSAPTGGASGPAVGSGASAGGASSAGRDRADSSRAGGSRR